MTARPLHELVEEGWARALEPVGPQVAQMGEFLRAELAAGRRYLPAGCERVARLHLPVRGRSGAHRRAGPLSHPGHAVGLSFSVAADVRPLPRSLANIFAEYTTDLGYPEPANGDLTPWAQRGVMLLNRVLTVRPRQPGVASRQGLGDGHRMRDPGVGGPVAAHGGGVVGPRRVHAETHAGR